MKQSVRLVASLALSAGFVAGAAMAADITGAGATFPYPCMRSGPLPTRQQPATT
jgi:ABC-type phosphate transport system substrate-binding protein